MNTGIKGQQMVRFYPDQLKSYRYWYRNVSQVQKLSFNDIWYRYNSLEIQLIYRII